MKKDQKLGYRIQKIITSKFSFEEFEEDELNSLIKTPKALNVNISSDIKFDNESSTITVDIRTSLNRSEDNLEMLKHSGRTTYYVQGLANTYDQDNDSYSLPDNLILQLVGIAFSHARALLSVELSSTNFRDKFFLPVINPKSLLPKTDT